MLLHATVTTDAHCATMPRYFFRLQSQDEITHPDKSRELPDVAAALAAANGMVRALLDNPMRPVPLPSRGSLDVEDERRRPIARVLLADVARQLRLSTTGIAA